MKKKLFICLLLLSVVLVPATAGDHFHISFFLGSNAMWGVYDRPFLECENGISLSYGMNLGLSSRVEFTAGMVSSMVPLPFEENTAYGEFQVALLGPTSTASKVSGSNVNMLCGLGGFYSWAPEGYQAAGPFISLTPLTLSSPISGRRERMMKTSFGWDFVNNKAVLAFSLLHIDFFVRGSYRDYY